MQAAGIFFNQFQLVVVKIKRRHLACRQIGSQMGCLTTGSGAGIKDLFIPFKFESRGHQLTGFILNRQVSLLKIISPSKIAGFFDQADRREQGPVRLSRCLNFSQLGGIGHPNAGLVADEETRENFNSSIFAILLNRFFDQPDW